MTLKEYRERAGLKQIDVAKKLDVDQSTVSGWESGRAVPFKKYHKRIARLYGATVEELFENRRNGEA